MECHTSQGRCFTAPCRVYVTGELCFLSTPTPSAFPLKRIIKIYIYICILFLIIKLGGGCVVLFSNPNQFGKWVCSVTSWREFHLGCSAEFPGWAVVRFWFFRGVWRWKNEPGKDRNKTNSVYFSSHNHGSGKWVLPILVSLHLG